MSTLKMTKNFLKVIRNEPKYVKAFTKYVILNMSIK